MFECPVFKCPVFKCPETDLTLDGSLSQVAEDVHCARFRTIHGLDFECGEM